MRYMNAAGLLLLFAVAAIGADLSAKKSPADDLKALQGQWKIAAIWWPSDDRDRLPKEARLNDEAGMLTIQGNQILHDGKTVATLANDLPSSAPHKEVGWSANRLVLLTLPDGKGLWCSYRIEEKRIQLTYPHTASCHRGSGQIIYLQRPAK